MSASARQQKHMKKRARPYCGRQFIFIQFY